MRNGYQSIAIELLSSSIIAKSEEYSVSAIVDIDIDNITAACNGGSIRKHYVRTKIAVSAR